MPETSYSRAFKLQKGALVQLLEGVAALSSNIVPFQFNPEKVSRSIEVWASLPSASPEQQKDAPMAQPYLPEETISMQLELDASDQLEADDPVAKQFGLGPRIAALEGM